MRVNLMLRDGPSALDLLLLERAWALHRGRVAPDRVVPGLLDSALMQVRIVRLGRLTANRFAGRVVG